MVIMAMHGAMRRAELYNLMPGDVTYIEQLDEIDVKILKTKNNKPRAFKISNAEGDYVKIVKKYMALAGEVRNRKAFFVAYSKGKCSSNRVGINTFGKVFARVATFLKLDSPQLFTGHAGRRSSATALAQNRGTVLQLQKLGGWKSVAVAQGYVEESNALKRDTAALIMKKENKGEDTAVAGPSRIPNPENHSVYNNCTFYVGYNNNE